MLIVAAIGLLGVAGLTMNNLKSSANSAWRSQAALLADDAAERLRVHNVWQLGASGLPVASPAYRMHCVGGVPGDLLPGVRCTAAHDALDCPDPAAMRTTELENLCSKVADVSRGGVPGGALLIDPVTDASGRTVYRIEVGWDARSASAGAVVPRASYVMEVRP
ncbi:hypothetical protein AVW16_03495 [Crenobacter luteus]|uniref:Type IV pilus modification protein PilV n=1 Tax=Crenobacter luteus TaxID=1452487 RepID=A0A165ELC1_9NEIS|nr:hypothetical protein AVW16_03495 [Crenobacter luteus]